MPSRLTRSCFVAILGLAAVGPAHAEETVGRRLFSNTPTVSEPFVEDELTLPSVLLLRRPSGDLTTQVGVELKKRITRDFELSIGGGLRHLDGGRDGTITGLDNLEIGLKYQFLRDPEREAVASLALRWEVGGTGRSSAGAESFHSLTPAVLAGVGLGPLPASLTYLRPLAITGLLGVRVPSSAAAAHALAWGLVLEYSLPYLQEHVRHLGLPPPLDRLFPLVELSGETALDRGSAGETTGTLNVGAVWVSDVVQIGIEGVVPLNERSGKDVGLRAFLRFSLDELFGGRLGRPLF